MGILYYFWDDKDNPEYYSPTYLIDNWDFIDTVALVAIWAIGQIIICLHIFKNLFFIAARIMTISIINIVIGLASLAGIAVLCLYIDEESGAFWTFVWALVCGAEFVLSAIFYALWYLMIGPAKPYTAVARTDRSTTN
ncbi:MAG: hypothetical protein V2I33_24950 [Kangiellaceae bacterium]|jgi:hypothetical protein|nr:hypothetical protein [Kangiellaceae bacterium]